MSETTPEQTDWDLVITQQADDELIRNVIARSAAEIESFLVSDDQTEEETLALLSRRLSGSIDPQTYESVLSALRALLGLDGANLVHWYIVANGAATGILEQVAPPRVAFFVRRIAAAHEPEVRTAFAYWNELPDDWRTVLRDVHWDFTNQRHVVRHRIQKLNGDEVVIETKANSALDLARIFVTTIRIVGDRNAFGEREIEFFLEEADAVLEMLRPKEDASENGDVAVPEIGEHAEM